MQLGQERSWRHFDWALAATAVALVAYGLALIYSGSLTNYSGKPLAVLTHPVARQALFAAVGIVAMFALARLHYHRWYTLAWPLYGASMIALAAVLVIGTSNFGARRWLFEVAGFQFQPSEVAKLATIIALARYFSVDPERARTVRGFLVSLGIAGLPAALTLVEPDLGTATVFLLIWVVVAFVAGVRVRHLGVLTLVGVLLVPFVLVFGLSSYQRDRLRTFVSPEKYEREGGYNIIQAEVAIGGGGLFGKGLTHGTQTQLEFLRTQTTDYVFSVLGEELGFTGALVLFGLFTLLLMRGIRTASVAPDQFGRLLVLGGAMLILGQAFINVAVNVRLFPVTGIPLPFISAGGTAMLTMFVCLGLVESVALRHRELRYR